MNRTKKLPRFRRNRKKKQTPMTCNPDRCPNCQYIGEGDSYCDVIDRIVLADWEPTKYFMTGACPYITTGKEKTTHETL